MKHIATVLCILISFTVSISQELVQEFRLQDRPQHLDVKDIFPTDDGYYVIADRSSYEFGAEGPIWSYVSLLKVDQQGEIIDQSDFDAISSSNSLYYGDFDDKVAYEIRENKLFVSLVNAFHAREDGTIYGDYGLVIETKELATDSTSYHLLPQLYDPGRQIRIVHHEVINEDSLHVFVAPLRPESGSFIDEYRINVETGEYELHSLYEGNLLHRSFRREATGSFFILDSLDSVDHILSTKVVFESISGSTHQLVIPSRAEIGLKTIYLDETFYVLIDQRILSISPSGEMAFVTDRIPFRSSDFTYDATTETFYVTSWSTNLQDSPSQLALWNTSEKTWDVLVIPGEPYFIPSIIMISDDQIIVGGSDLQYSKYWEDYSEGYSDSSHVGNGIIRFLDLQSITPTVDVDQNDFEVSIFPNPAVDHVMVRSPEKMSRIQVFDYTGRLVKAIQNLQVESYQMSVADLPPGIYQLRMSAGVARISSAPLLVH